MAINTYPQPAGWKRWERAVNSAAGLGVKALILADIGVMDYAARRWPELPLHLSVQASGTNLEALRFSTSFSVNGEPSYPACCPWPRCDTSSRTAR